MKPVLQALVLAEHVYTDKSGKKIIAGTFGGIRFKRGGLIHEQKCPDGTTQRVIEGGTVSGSPYAYIALKDVINKAEISLQFVNLSKNEVIFESTFSVESDDRFKLVEIVAPLPPLAGPWTEDGIFAFEVLCEGEIIGSHRLHMKESG